MVIDLIRTLVLKSETANLDQLTPSKKYQHFSMIGRSSAGMTGQLTMSDLVGVEADLDKGELQKTIRGQLYRLHPNITFSNNYDVQEPAYKNHQALKLPSTTGTRNDTAVLFVLTERDIAVEIDSWEHEDCLRLSPYGKAQLEELIGEEAFNYLKCTRCHLFPYFFGNHFFNFRYYDSAIKLANFAARRSQNPDFRYWFEEY